MQDFRRTAITATHPSSLAVDANLPWPQGLAPRAAAMGTVPKDTQSLARFSGYDAVVVTWTSAEADTLAALFTPGHPPSSWYELRADVDQYAPLVTGPKAPFNDASPEMRRYYHSLALYMPARVGTKRVLCMKSGLHMDYDGPAVPVRKLMRSIAQTVRPGLFITTGTGGGIFSQSLNAPAASPVAGVFADTAAVVHNGSLASFTYDLPQIAVLPPGWRSPLFSTVQAGVITVAPNATDKIGTKSTGSSLASSSAAGNNVRLRAGPSQTWLIETQVGTWS